MKKIKKKLHKHTQQKLQQQLVRFNIGPVMHEHWFENERVCMIFE